MKRILLLLLLGSFSIQVRAQDIYEFDYIEDKLDLSILDDSFNYSHFMGETIGKKLELLKLSYTWQEDPTPTSPTALTVVEKPMIYNNIKKIERYYKKAIKKGEISEEQAANEFEGIIDIALFVRYQKTDQLESRLESIKEEREMVQLFTNNIQLNYY
ncbi:hypothetical protein [Marinoscillum sp. MHG1-6]|uniref:hypothetical protein n=1 Tax=Marinoscillum sp. MHG1-6 TaxID=2959627 RepID=UPI0021588579|nr:hypothetical protein [Marinoscillum sp. MHG1-6]